MYRIFSLALLFGFLTCSATAENRTDALKRLRVVHDSYKMNLNEIEKLMIQQVMSTQTIKLGKKNEKTIQQNLSSSLEQLTALRSKYLEYKQRMYFVDRLIFQVESKYTNGSSLKSFLEQQLLDMAYTEITAVNNQSSDAQTWKFMINLSIALREALNPHEDVIGFIESFTSYSTVLEPKSPLNFMRDVNYLNGSQVQTANPIPAQEVGEAWEEQVKKITNKPDLFPSNTINQEKISLPEMLGSTPEAPISTQTIFDRDAYSPTQSQQQSEPSELRLQYDGYSIQ